MTERGSLTVEAALVIPVLLLVGLAVFEAASAMAVQFQIVAAVRDGARVAATTPDVATAADVTRSLLPSAVARTARIAVERPAVAGRPATVSVSTHLPLRTPVLAGVRIPLGWSASMLVEP